jgi:hypothetical protein
MSNDRQPIRIFFSWQKDLPQGPTTLAIRAALRAASSEIEATQEVDITLEEATSNASGSPYIPHELAEKIRRSDIVVCDITPVVRLPDENGKPNGKSLPNANVTFELGVASAQVGWNRIIMLLNTELSAFKDLPFDFDRHRISTYRMQDGAMSQKAGANSLKSLLAEAVRQIIKDNPLRPRDLEGKAPSEIKHARDVENITWFMRQFSVGMLDRHISDMPDYLNSSAIFMSAGITDIIKDSNFHLYDPNVYAAAKGLQASLEKTLDYIVLYRETPNPDRQIFGHRAADFGYSANERAAKASIIQARDQLGGHLSTLIGLVRERYLEVDIDETNQLFATSYKAMDEKYK